MGIERTIQSLSNKIWYRFIKVLYILCFLFISSIALFISYDAYKPKKIFDNEKSYIQCTATEGILYILALNGVYLWSDYISSDNDKMFSQWCLNAIQEEAKPKTRQQDTPMITEIENFKKKYPQFADIDDATIADWLATKYPNAYGDLPAKVKRQAPSPEMKKEPIGETKGSRWQDAPIIPDTSYKLVSHYKTEGTWNNFVIASIVSITTIFLIFETGRRIFYYVILGSLFPRKKA